MTCNSDILEQNFPAYKEHMQQYIEWLLVDSILSDCFESFLDAFTISSPMTATSQTWIWNLVKSWDTGVPALSAEKVLGPAVQVDLDKYLDSDKNISVRVDAGTQQGCQHSMTIARALEMYAPVYIYNHHESWCNGPKWCGCPSVKTRYAPGGLPVMPECT